MLVGALVALVGCVILLTARVRQVQRHAGIRITVNRALAQPAKPAWPVIRNAIATFMVLFGLLEVINDSHSNWRWLVAPLIFMAELGVVYVPVWMHNAQLRRRAT